MHSPLAAGTPMHCVLVAGSGNLDAQRKVSLGHSIVTKALGWNILAVKMCLSFQADSVGLTFTLLQYFLLSSPLVITRVLTKRSVSVEFWMASLFKG